MAGENYRRVVPTFWTDPDVKRKLTREQKLLLLYFCTSPHSNMIGVYYCPLAYASNEADLPVDDIRRALAGPLAGFVTYDEETEEVFVHALAKHNIGDELTAAGKNGKPDHRIAGVEKLLEAVHSPRLRRAFLTRYADAYRLTMPLPDQREAPSEPLASPLGSPSEAIAVHSSNKTKHSAPAPRSVPSPDEQAVLDHYRTVHPKRLRGAPPDKVLRLLRSALRSYPATDLCRAIDGNAASQFHRDGGHLGLDLILRDATKIDFFLDLAQKAASQAVEMTDEFGEMRLHTKRDGWWGYEQNGAWVRTIEVAKVSA